MNTTSLRRGAAVGTLTAAVLAALSMPTSADAGTQSKLTVLHGPDQGTGHVKVEPTGEDQGTLVNQVTVNVEGLEPSTTYNVDRAIDRTPGDGVCTISPPGNPLGWTTDATITTSSGGSGAVHYDAHRANVPAGTSLDIIFRVENSGTELRSACMTFTAK